jgi:RNA polymerase sigma-70 factor (ECF subfamily)
MNDMQDESIRRRLESSYRECRTALKAFVRRYLRRPEDVEDVTQETFLRVLEAADRTDFRDAKAYLFTTARNLSLKHIALHANKVTSALADFGELEVMDTANSLDAEVEVWEQVRLFYEALMQLPPQCRRVLILKKVYELSHEEIAEHLGISVSTANQHLAKGLARCTLYLQQRGYLEHRATAGTTGRSDEG